MDGKSSVPEERLCKLTKLSRCLENIGLFSVLFFCVLLCVSMLSCFVLFCFVLDRKTPWGRGMCSLEWGTKQVLHFL